MAITEKGKNIYFVMKELSNDKRLSFGAVGCVPHYDR